MGPSGSGKTTLLDVLAGRKTAGKIEGRVLFAGVKPTSMFLRRYTGYVEQFGDQQTLLPPSMTAAVPLANAWASLQPAS
jgi:ABC-type multidrug transport system ATPase subunit